MKNSVGELTEDLKYCFKRPPIWVGITLKNLEEGTRE
jgi:hypothetical protein